MRAFICDAKLNVMHSKFDLTMPNRAVGLLTVVFLLIVSAVKAADFTVETPGGQYQFLFNGANAATLTLVRGQTYTFDVQTTYQHPFHIESPGVENNDITSGIITYTVPTNNANYAYNCGIHPWMFGDIITIEPPRIEILNLSIGTNLVLTSTATNGWKVYPEYATNLASTNWYALTVQTNRLVNGTLETICGRPEGNPILIRIRSSP